METLVTLITLPIGFLNFGGGIVAGIWLIIVGKWMLVVGALISTVISTWILGLLMMPTLLLAAPIASERVQKSKLLVFILGGLSNLWTYLLMLLYGVGSFMFILGNYDGGMILPYLLLAYSVATSPWTYMAQGESQANNGNTGMGTLMPVFGICVASIVMMIKVFLYGNIDFTSLAVVCVIPLALAYIVHMVIIFLMLKESGKEQIN